MAPLVKVTELLGVLLLIDTQLLLVFALPLWNFRSTYIQQQQQKVQKKMNDL
jgi:hypothetical protein